MKSRILPLILASALFATLPALADPGVAELATQVGALRVQFEKYQNYVRQFEAAGQGHTPQAQQYKNVLYLVERDLRNAQANLSRVDDANYRNSKIHGTAGTHPITSRYASQMNGNPIRNGAIVRTYGKAAPGALLLGAAVGTAATVAVGASVTYSPHASSAPLKATKKYESLEYVNTPDSLTSFEGDNSGAK